MEFVKITRPGVEGLGVVPVSALEHWGRGGWTLAPEPEPVPDEEPVGSASDGEPTAATSAAKPKTAKPRQQPTPTED